MNGTIAILGGTGAEGHGLGKRFAQAGHQVVLGSRLAERAEAAAAAINAELGSSLVRGAENAEAVRPANMVVLTIPYAGMVEALSRFAERLAGKTLVSAIVPLEFVGGGPRIVRVPAGSAAQELQAALPDSLVIGAFHHLSAPTLSDLTQSIDADVLVCGDNVEARRAVMELADELPGARGIDAGPLESAGHIEAFTTVLLRINRRYKAHAGVRVTHLPNLSSTPA